MSRVFTCISIGRGHGANGKRVISDSSIGIYPMIEEEGFRSTFNVPHIHFLHFELFSICILEQRSAFHGITDRQLV